MNETPPTVAEESGTSTAATVVGSELNRPKGALSERHFKYAEEFKTWMLDLNRHDFAQVRGILEKITRAYFKHTVKIHSPPMKAENNDPSKASDGASDSVLPDPPASA